MEKDLFKDWKKPDWDSYYMSMALLVSMRSIDPSAKYGCVIVDKDNKVLSIGYNGPPAGMNDEKVPLDRPKKYLIMEHAEKNAIINRQLPIKGATLYVLAYPCVNCMRSIIQSGIKRVVHGPFKSRAVGKENDEVIRIMLEGREDIKVEEYKGDILSCLNSAIKYFDIKLGSGNKTSDFSYDN